MLNPIKRLGDIIFAYFYERYENQNSPAKAEQGWAYNIVAREETKLFHDDISGKLHMPMDNCKYVVVSPEIKQNKRQRYFFNDIESLAKQLYTKNPDKSVSIISDIRLYESFVNGRDIPYDTPFILESDFEGEMNSVHARVLQPAEAEYLQNYSISDMIDKQSSAKVLPFRKKKKRLKKIS